MQELSRALMTRSQFCWLVAVLQTALAVCLWWYAPSQIVAAQQGMHDRYPNQSIELGPDFYRRNVPAPAERVSLALNYPAAILAGPLNILFPRPLYETRLRLLSPKDLAFFGWTGVLWFWLTSKLYRSRSTPTRLRMSRSLRLSGIVFGLIFALFMGAIGFETLANRLSTTPERQVAPFGLLWSIGFTVYFGWKLRLELAIAKQWAGGPDAKS